MTKFRVAFSYNALRRHVTERYLSDTFPSPCAIHLHLNDFGPDISADVLVEMGRGRDKMPDLLAHVIDTGLLPLDLNSCRIPTASLDIDSFAWTSSRIRWSMLFDYVFLWHPSLVPVYKAAGHPKVFAFPHAVDEILFRQKVISTDRSFDLGWVGAFGWGQYAQRKRIIKALERHFKMNDSAKYYTKEETAGIYKQSKIVVNVSRQDCPEEANMRCYEAMAGGALLITGMPTELTEWGFREGEHFMGWRNEAEIPELVDYYLRHELERKEIAHAGQVLTLSDFTFQKCRDKMTAVLREHPNEFFAPARNWLAPEVSLIYLEYYYRFQSFGPALTQFCGLRNFGAYWKGLPMMLKTTRHRLKRLA